MAEFVQLFNTLEKEVPSTHTLYSEKFDGARMIHIPGWVHRGYSGPMSRRARPYIAPRWFLDALPHDRVLDGELWLGYGTRQELLSIIRQHKPDERWKDIKYRVFEEVPYCRAASDREFEDSTRKKERVVYDWTIHNNFERGAWPLRPTTWSNDIVIPVVYHQYTGTIPPVPEGAEGWMFRNPRGIWTPSRNSNGLKYKPLRRAMCTITGYTEGRGKHEGRAGAFTVNSSFGVFEINCGTDEQRDSAYLMVGREVEFIYRELTDAGLPHEARLVERGL